MPTCGPLLILLPALQRLGFRNLVKKKVPEHYPKDASGRLEYDKNLIKELEEKTTGVIRNMCMHNPPSAQPTYKDKKSDLIYKRVFCDFI